MRMVSSALVAFFCVWPVSGFGAQNADVLPGAVYKCQTPGGKVVYSNVFTGEKHCAALFTYLVLNTARPGLAGWRPFYRDDDIALLIYDDRTVVLGTSASSWVMYSLTKSSLAPRSHRPYTRAIAKVTADCVRHNLDTSTIQYWDVTGPNITAVEVGVGGHEEVAPNTSEDLVVAEVCKGPPKKDKGKSQK